MKNIFILAITFFVGACASNQTNRVSPDQSSDLRASKIVVNSFVVEKKINYIETLYRVLWLETKSSSMEFGGIWNPDEEFSDLVSGSLRDLNMESDSLYSIVNAQIINDYRAALKADYLSNSSGNHPQIKGAKLAPNLEYSKKYPELREFESVRNDLIALGYNYFFEYLGSDVYGNAPGYGMVVVTMPSQLRIIDLQNKTVLWTHITFTHEVYQMGGNLKKLEENNLLKLKEALDIGIKEVMSAEKVSPMLIVESGEPITN